MSMMVTCPTCQSMLRLPDGAEMVRCPKCKTVLSVENPNAPKPPAKIPLPFGLPAGPVAPVSPPPVTARPAPPPASRPPTRGKPIEEHEEYDDDEGDPTKPKKSWRETDSEKEARKLEAIDVYVQPAKIGMRLMAYGAVASALTPIFFLLFFVSTLIGPSGIMPVLYLCTLVLSLHWPLTFVGFAYCCAGPRAMRSMAVAGLCVMLAHSAVTFVLVRGAGEMINLNTTGFHHSADSSAVVGSLILSGLFNNLSYITHLPAYILFSSSIGNIAWMIWPMLAAGLEFAKLSLIGIITNAYCIEGKDPEAGYLALRFVYRIFWLVIIGVVLEIALILGFTLTGGDRLLLAWFGLPVMLIVVGYNLWWAFAWYEQCRVMFDSLEVMTAARFADKRARMDTYY